MLHTYPRASAHTWLKASLSTLGFCGALLAAPAAHAQVVASTPKIEAENSTITGSSKVAIATTLTPFSGNGYVDYNDKPSAVTFAYTAAAAGSYDIVVRYESQFDTKIGALSVNGGTKAPLYFNATAPKAGSDNFRSTTPRRIVLTAGANTITISDNDYGYFGIDYIQVAPSSATAVLTPTAAGRVEAESGQLIGAQALVRDGDASTHSGATYVGLFSETSTNIGSTITLPVNVATAGLYQIAVGARELFGSKSFDLAVKTGTTTSGPLTTSLGATASPDFQSFTVGKFNMTAGTNMITITSQTSFIEVDYVDITATTGVATAARAGAEAQKALSAYPNPTNGQALNVGLELANAQETTFDLVNTLGQRVSTATRSLRAGSNQLQLPTTGVAGGIYQLVVRGGDQPTLVQRVVVN